MTKIYAEADITLTGYADLLCHSLTVNIRWTKLGGEAMSEENKVVARRFFEEIYSQGKVDLIEELMSPNYVAIGAGAYAQGHEAVRKSILSKPPDINVVVEEQIAEGDKVVSRLAFSSGGKSWVGVAIQRIENGKLAETWRVTNRGG